MLGIEWYMARLHGGGPFIGNLYDVSGLLIINPYLQEAYKEKQT